MVNLFVALIIVDIEDLKRKGTFQETLNKAFDIISYGQVMKYWESIFGNWHKGKIITSQADICVHEVCFNCDRIKLPKDIKAELQNVARRKLTKN